VWVLSERTMQAVVMCDILTKLVMDNSVVFVKMNQVNDYWGPFIAQAFKPLVDLGLLEIACVPSLLGPFFVQVWVGLCASMVRAA
jgi:hypothetical protein